jgi:response regulator RpfG family c-di-GMP phosphodiesterase
MRVRTIVGAPLRGTEGILGVIGLARGDSSRFDEEEIALLDRFGRVAAIALDNARLHESLQVELAERRRTEEELLDTVSRLSRSELELRRAQAETIRKLADAAEFRDAETGHHTERMSRMCELIARRMGLDEERCRLLRDASPLHDIGKIAIPDAILNKPGPLDSEEWSFMRRHTLIGESMLSAAPSLHHAARIVRCSHERFDGGGYPDGLSGEEIPLASRIVFVCDAFHAMTSSRPYGEPRTAPGALEELSNCAGTQFDPAVVKAFRAEIGELGPREAELILELDAEAQEQPLAAGTADQRHADRQPAR